MANSKHEKAITDKDINMFYKTETKKYIDQFTRENVLRYIWIIVADIAHEQGLISEVPYSLQD